MSKNPFLSKEVKPKRIIYGLLLTSLCLFIILYLGTYYTDLIDNSLREYYVGNQETEVLGLEETNGLEIYSDSKLEEMKEAYGIDEYIYNWDRKIEGYDTLSEYVREPRFYISGDVVEVSQTWILKDGYELELYCPPKNIEDVVPGIFDGCKVTYNDVLINDYVRNYIRYPDEGETVDSTISLAVYSPPYHSEVKDHEFLVIGLYAGGSYDNILVFKLEDGVAVQKQFLHGGELLDTWMVSYPMSFRFLYSEDEEFKLLTLFTNPWSGFLRVYRVWSLEDEYFTLDRTIGDIQ